MGGSGNLLKKSKVKHWQLNFLAHLNKILQSDQWRIDFVLMLSRGPVGFSQLQLHNILLTMDYFQKSRIPFLTKSPRMMEKSDIKNASLIICFEKSTYEKIQKGMVFS